MSGSAEKATHLVEPKVKVQATSGLKIPDASVIFAGGVGGPLALYVVTPARNALTLGASDSAAGIGSLYRQVFRGGLARGWAGGVYPAAAACPSFICLGPVYHMIAESAGQPLAIVAASAMETAIMYGGETANAQIAKNDSKPGTWKTTQPAWKPWGPGITIHLARNILATCGLRVFCKPCTWAIETATGKQNAVTQIAGDFGGNVLSACMTAPVHQLYGFMATNPELSTISSSELRQRMMGFLKDTYMITKDGVTRFKPTLPRDLAMRSMYCATLYTFFSSFERTVIANWPF